MVRSNVLIARLKKGPDVYLLEGEFHPLSGQRLLAVLFISLTDCQCQVCMGIFPIASGSIHPSPSFSWITFVFLDVQRVPHYQKHYEMANWHRQLLQAYMLDMAWIIRNITYTILHWGIYLCLSKSSSMSPFSHWQTSVKPLILMNLPLPH